ncbi:MAG: DNA-processing protein DprA [Synergistaceae bacterium]|nr:DNA-processing protein DprA [Synergistaceae bacterium]
MTKNSNNGSNSQKAMLLLNAARLPYRYADEFLCGDPEALWVEAEALWGKLNFPQAVNQRLRILLDKNWAEKEAERLQNSGVNFIPANDDEYPEKLRNIQNPPVGIYVKGNWRNFSGKSSIGVVGTRRCSSYGRHVAHSIGEALPIAGISVVSGGALGIDAAAHFGCLGAGGSTAAVFGTGINLVYPTKHKELFERITENGAIVTEYPFGVQGNAWNFPERNRIIVGLSDRLVVVEAPVDSGAMITAKLALDAGIEIWSVPGQITDKIALGTNKLLRDGANVLADIAEFIEIVGGRGNQYLIPFPNEKTNITISDEEKIILQILSLSGNKTVDDIVAESKMNLPQVQFCLSSLIASGFVYLAGPGRFSADSGKNI